MLQLPQRVLGDRSRSSRAHRPAGLDAHCCAPSSTDGGEAVAEAGHDRGRRRAPQPVALPASGIGRRRAWRSAWRPTTRRRPVRRQLESIRAQTHGNWVCIISDDCSSPAGFEATAARRSVAIRASSSRARRAGSASIGTSSARSSLVPARTPSSSPWPTRTTAGTPTSWPRCSPRLGDAQLVYSDARVVSRGGELISETWWNTRRNNHSDLLSLLVANAVTGAASLFRRELLDDALPFPPAQFAHFHDHWLGADRAGLGRHRVRRPPALRLRPARRAPRSDTRRPTG